MRLRVRNACKCIAAVCGCLCVFGGPGGGGREAAGSGSRGPAQGSERGEAFGQQDLSSLQAAKRAFAPLMPSCIELAHCRKWR